MISGMVMETIDGGAVRIESHLKKVAMASADETTSPLQDYLELLRLPNVFTAVADVVMGFFFVQAPWAFSHDPQRSLLPVGVWTVGLLAAASALLYSAGMVLNDVFDIELDRQEQPYRPLPSGRIPLSSARWLGWQLLTLGIMLASGTAVMLARFARTPTTSSSPGCRRSWPRHWPC